jgi:hypothetical protein
MRTHATATRATLLGLGLALAACAPSFDGPEEIKALRLLAVQAEPPELGAVADGEGAGWPAAAASLRALVGHPDFVADGPPRAIVLHLSCTPAPGDLQAPLCTQFAQLTDPSGLVGAIDTAGACAAPGRGAVNAITFSGLEACDRSGCVPFSVRRDPEDAGSAVALPAPGYTLPDGLALSSLPAGHVQRVLGLDVVDLQLVLEAAPDDVAPAAAMPDACATLGAVLERIGGLWETRPHVVGLKWLHVRGPDMPAESAPNVNPVVSAMSFDGATLPPPGAAPAAVTPGLERDLLPVLPGDFAALRQRYQRFDTNARYVDTRNEEWTYSWFTTAGELKDPRTYAWDDAQPFEPAAGPAVLWLVVRDLRGGSAWTAAAVEGAP